MAGARERGHASHGGEGLLEVRLVQPARHGDLAVEQGDQRAPHRDAADEGLGAVDGVDDPAVAAVGAAGAPLLALELVLGVPLGDRGPEDVLDAAVGLGDRVVPVDAALVLGEQLGPEVLEGQRPGDLEDAGDERSDIGHQVVGLGHRHHPTKPRNRGQVRAHRRRSCPRFRWRSSGR